MVAKHDRKESSVTDEASRDATNKGPLWSDQSESRRVRASIWKHGPSGGKARYTVGICRSYFDKDDDRWVNTHYYDRKDLDDVIGFAQAAKKKLDRIIDGVPEEADRS